MVERDIGSLLVIEKGKLTGLLTFREVLAAINRHRGDIHEVRVGQVMVGEPVCANPDESVDHMRSIMTDQHIRYLPIMEHDALIGVLWFHDVAKAALREVNFENKLLKQFIKDWPEHGRT